MLPIAEAWTLGSMLVVLVVEPLKGGPSLEEECYRVGLWGFISWSHLLFCFLCGYNQPSSWSCCHIFPATMNLFSLELEDKINTVSLVLVVTSHTPPLVFYPNNREETDTVTWKTSFYFRIECHYSWQGPPWLPICHPSYSPHPFSKFWDAVKILWLVKCKVVSRRTHSGPPT